VQALVVYSLIHADCNISCLQARLSQLIPVAGFSKSSYSMLLEELERSPVVALISCFIQSCNRAARQNAPILDIERVQIGFSDNAPEGVSPAYEVDNHAAILANSRFRTASYWLVNACYLQSDDEGTRSPFSGEPIKVNPCRVQPSAVRSPRRLVASRARTTFPFASNNGCAAVRWPRSAEVSPRIFSTSAADR